MATKAEKEAAKAAKLAEKEAASAQSADEPEGFFKVFYRELTPDGTRTGAVSHKIFNKRKDAEKFAESVGERVV